MTISTTTSTVTYQGNGATTVFSFPFVADQATDIVVTYTDSGGNQTVLGPTQYTLIINPTPSGGLWGIGGTVTYPTIGSPIAVGTFITIARAVPYEQLVSINNQGAFYPQAVEQGLDILEMQIQQLGTDLEYTLKTPTTDLIPPIDLPVASVRANGYLAFDSQGQPEILHGDVPIPVQIEAAVPRIVNVSTTTTVALNSDDNFSGVSIYQSGSAVTTVQLPSTEGPWPIFDGSSNAGTYPIKVLPPIGKLMPNSQSQYYLSYNGQSLTFYYDTDTVLIA